MAELEITPENFNEYFFDIRLHKPQKGQIIAQYRACAELLKGDLKRDLIKLLSFHENGGVKAHQVMMKLGGAVEKEAYKVVREIAEDLLAGMSVDDVLEKPHDFILEHFFYTKKEYVPKDDPHWSVINLVDLTKENCEAVVENSD